MRVSHVRSFRQANCNGEDPVSKVLIGGIGNVLLGDDGVGPFVVRTLQSLYEFPADVEIADLGTPGLDLVVHLASADTLILVDCVNSSLPVGTVTAFKREDILRNAPAPRMDPHSPALTESLLIAEMAGGGQKRAILIGIVGKHFEGAALSPEVRKAIPQALNEIIRAAASMRLSYRRRPKALDPGIWWEQVAPGYQLHPSAAD